jgi:hypothetical protein
VLVETRMRKAMSAIKTRKPAVIVANSIFNPIFATAPVPSSP